MPRAHSAFFSSQIAGDPDAAPAEVFEREIKWRVDSLQTVRVDTRYSPASQAKIPPTESYDVIIAALLVRVADRKDSVSLPIEQIQLVESLLNLPKPVIIACFGSPYVIDKFPQASSWLAAFSTADSAQRAAARALFGEIATAGKIPVSVPDAKPPIKIGEGITKSASPMTLRAFDKGRESKFAAAHDLLNRSVADHAFPGGVLAIGHKRELAIHPFGRQAYESGSRAVTPDTIYDVASLTKPVVTTTLIAMEVEAGRISLDAPIGNYLLEWNLGSQPEWRSRVTIRHLLTHTSGLPGHVAYYESLKSKREIIRRALSEQLISTPGEKCEYSDPGFILLGNILEVMSGRPLELLAQQKILTPLEMNNTMFNPSRSFIKRIAPTGSDSPLRKGLIQGTPHDDNTFVMGGIAGHAGLFSTADDLAVFCQMMLNGGIYAHHRLLKRSDRRRIHFPAAARKKYSRAWMGRAHGTFRQRQVFFGTQFRSRRIHRYLDLVRPGKRTLRNSADEPRSSRPHK